MTAKVLVVDDNQANIKLLHDKLIIRYYDVITATSGIQAIKIAKDQQPDVILLDIMMPEMDGYEACRRLKSDSETAYIPVVMVTALDNTKENRVKGLMSGADDFLSKPINDIALFARIRSLSRLKRTLDELRLIGKTNLEINAIVNTNLENSSQVCDAKILIMDQDTIHSEYMYDTLKQYFKDVIVSHDAGQALEISSMENYDLIIIDRQFDGDGLMLCSKLRNRLETRSVPILILFDEDDNSNMTLLTEAFEVGINDYIIDTVDKSELIARVNIQIKRKKYQDALRVNLDDRVARAIIDPLIGCYNRHYFDLNFQNMVNKAFNEKKNLSIMIVDVDHFKSVNDVFGHTSGDELLVQLQKRIDNNIRITDSLMARIGGEEFVVVLPGTNIESAYKVAERIRKKIYNTPFVIKEHEPISKTVSIGVAEMNEEDYNDVKKLIDRADKCLYEAKNSGRNKVVCYFSK